MQLNTRLKVIKLVREEEEERHNLGQVSTILQQLPPKTTTPLKCCTMEGQTDKTGFGDKKHLPLASSKGNMYYSIA